MCLGLLVVNYDMPPSKLKESDYCISWIVMILCYVVTFSMVGFAFNLVGMSFGWNVRNQGRLLGLITMPVQLVTSYVCFRFLARELAAKAVDRALNEKQDQLMAKNAVRPMTEEKSAEVAPLRTGGGNAA